MTGTKKAIEQKLESKGHSNPSKGAEIIKMVSLEEGRRFSSSPGAQGRTFRVDTSKDIDFLMEDLRFDNRFQRIIGNFVTRIDEALMNANIQRSHQIFRHLQESKNRGNDFSGINDLISEAESLGLTQETSVRSSLANVRQYFEKQTRDFNWNDFMSYISI